MSETSGFETVESAANNEQTAPVGNEGGESGGHPAWGEILGVIPTSLHSQVTPALQKWDTAMQEKLQSVQSKYDPYKSLVENEVDPDILDRALNVFGILQQDPQAFYRRMTEFYGQQDQGQAGQQNSGNEEEYGDDGEEFDITKHPKFQELSQHQEVIARFLYEQQQKEVAAQEDAELDKSLTELREKHGEFDEEFVLSVASQNGGDLEAAVQRYQGLVSKVQGTPKPGTGIPTPMSPTGGTPSSQVNPTDLNRQQTRDLVAQFLEQRNAG